MEYITRQSPEYQSAFSEDDSGLRNFYDPYLSQIPTGEEYWRRLGYAGPLTADMTESGGGAIDTTQLQQWLAANGMQYGVDLDTAKNALIDRSGNAVAGSEYSVDDTGDFMRDAALLIAAGYFGGNALSGAYGGGAAGATAGGAAAAESAPVWNAALAESAAGTAGYGASSAGAGGGATAAWGAGSGYTADAANAGAKMAGNSGTSLADFFSGNGSWNDYLRAGQGLYGMYAQNKATDAATAGNDAQLALQTRMYEENKALNQPLIDTRNSVLPQIQNLLANPSSITQDPSYQFQLKQGQNALNNRAAASGNYYSGAQQKAAQEYGQNFAGTKLDQSLNRLMGVATGTQVGANNAQQNAGNYAVAGGNALQQGGNIRAGGYIGQYNTVNNNVNDWMQDQNYRKYWGGGG